MQIKRPADLALTVRDRRLELGLTQAEVAHDAQVTRQLVARFESGASDTNSATLLRLLHTLKLDLHLSPTGEDRSHGAVEPAPSAATPPSQTSNNQGARAPLTYETIQSAAFGLDALLEHQSRNATVHRGQNE
ncbi:helix-turn-helix transcriptional regulator [Mycetocola saprophilus]|uniref:helix-turn-helix transcriptional regulator n=1 Tax=Mycetocola saprophilus TaxID=76636 RepID=UPI003BF02358